MKSILFIILATVSLQSYAENQYVCHSGDAERVIDVAYSSPTSKVPCEVKYTKSDGTRVLWSAQNEAGYCESKANELAVKLTDMGWTCSGISEQEVGLLPEE